MNYIKTFVLCAPQTDGISIPERSSAALSLYFSTKTTIPCTEFVKLESYHLIRFMTLQVMTLRAKLGALSNPL